MIITHVIRDKVGSFERLGPFEQEWSGRKICELATPESVGCIIFKRLIRRGDPEWEMIPDDGAVITFLETENGYAVAGAVIGYFGITGVGAIVGTFILGTAINFALSYAASFVLSAVLAPSANGLPEAGAGTNKTSPTYGFDNIQTTVQNGTVIPVVYGTHLVGGHLIQTERKIESADGHSGTLAQSETLYMLIALGEGHIGSIGNPDKLSYSTDQSNLEGSAIPDGIFLNGVEAKTFRQVSVSLRMGGTTQAICPGFENIVNEYPQEGRELAGDGAFEWDTRVEVTDLAARLVFPRGIYKTDETGGIENLDNPPAAAMEVFTQDGGSLVTRKEAVFDDANTNTLFGTISVTGLAPARYHVVVKRISGRPAYERQREGRIYEDHMFISAIKEIQHAAPTYNGIALLAIKIHATTQLSGAPPNVTAIIKGRKLQPISGGAWNPTEAWSDNPAYVCADALANPVYGGGKLIKRDHLAPIEEWEDWKEWAEETIPAYTNAVSSYSQPVADQFNGSSASIDPVVTGTYA